MSRAIYLSFLFLCLFAAGCAGGAFAPPRVTATAPAPNAQTAAATLTLSVHRDQTSSNTRRPQYVSPATQSVVVDYGGAQPAEMDVNASSPACTSSGGTLTCSIVVDVPVGNDLFSVSSYDRTGGQGNVLSKASVAQTIVMDTANVITLTLSGVVASVALSTATTPPTCTATSVPLIVTAKDAAGETIVGAANYSNAITVKLTDSSGATKLTGTTYAKPSDTGTLTYDGTYEPGAVLSASATGVSASAAPAFTFFPTPTVCHEYALTDAMFPLIQGITLGSDGNLYFAENNTHLVGKIVPTGTLKGTITEAMPLTTTTNAGSGTPDFLVNGSDGNLWIADGADAIDEMAVAGVPQNNYGKGTYQMSAVANGPASDGRIWFTDIRLNEIVASTTAGVLTPYAVATDGADATGIAAGPDGAMWISWGGSRTTTHVIGRLTTDGASYNEYPIPTPTGTEGVQPQYIVAGGDGKMYFSDGAGHKIGVVTASGTITEYPIPSGSVPHGETLGPDGNVWFVAENYNVTDQIGRILPDGTITEYPIPTHMSTPYRIVVGPDKNLWFTESRAGNGKIGYLVI